MSTNEVDRSKRRFLVAATAALGGVAAAATATPFVMSMLPSQRARAAGAPVEADISKVEPGMLLSVEWRGKPVWILHRTPEMLQKLSEITPILRDPGSNESTQPDYTKNPTRSIKPEYLVTVGLCTHLGCSPTLKKEIGAADLGADWPGGFFCPCHGSKFDLAARVFKDVPAPTNMEIPPHMYLSETRIVIGEDKEGAAA